MDRELRISVSVFLVFLIYGLSTFFSSGDFVTPFFLNKIVLVGVSLLFWVLNFTKKQAAFLAWAFIAMLIYAVNDRFTAALLIEKWHFSGLEQLLASKVFIYGTFILYFGFLFGVIYPLYLVTRKTVFSFVLIALALSTILTLYWVSPVLQSVFFILYLVLYFLVASRWGEGKSEVVNSLSALFILTALLEGFRFLV